MNAAVKINPKDCIELLNIDTLQQEEDEHLERIVDMFEVGVSELRLLIEKSNTVLHIATSQGKDSTIVELMALEAYKQAIESGSIEKERPLILSTVDTGGESIPMKLYVRYAKKRIMSYAKENGINLFYDIVKPPINDEYFIKYCGGQKLIPNATRSGDCSIILKVNPSEKYVKNLLNRFQKENGDTKVVSCIGSRVEESARRAQNLKQQNLSTKTAKDLEDELEVESLGKSQLYKFAPIKNWSTEQVFDALRLAGSKPLRKLKNRNGIPGFLPDYAILLEVYGNGSSETCEISIGSNSGSGCNGKARYGCTYCTMVGNKDKSSSALSQLPRWASLGVENALRVRDYLFRLSTDIDARAFHARAVDPVGYNRAALQPNTLRPKYLEKMVRLASQLTMDSIQVANEFSKLVAEGREMEHPGYRDIAEDVNMPPKTKRAFLEMYKEGVQEPENLNYLFSEQHTLLLSFRWSLDGIGAAPFRPLAIWRQIESGKGRIPYPKLNSEYEEIYGPVSMSGNDKLPESVMFSTLKVEDAHQHALNPVSLLQLWSRPNDISDVYDEEMNCSISRKASNVAKVEISCKLKFETKLKGREHLTGQDICINSLDGIKVMKVKRIDVEILDVLLSGKKVPAKTQELLVQAGIEEQVDLRFDEQINEIRLLSYEKVFKSEDEGIEYFERILEDKIGQPWKFKRDVKHLKPSTLFTGYKAQSRKLPPKLNFTQRVTKVTRKGIKRGNTRMNFYPHHVDSRLHLAHQQQVQILEPNFDTHTEKFVGTHDEDLLVDSESAAENIFLHKHSLSKWKAAGGLDRALELHDEFLKNHISNRHKFINGTFNLRRFGGTYAAEQLLSEGVVSIAKGYWSQLQSILKRTHIFQELGLFEFQSKKAHEVVSHPNAIQMKQHRQDKAKVCLSIRNHRNEQRRKVKENLTKPELLVSYNLEEFKNNAIRAISTTTNYYQNLLKFRFNTSEVNPKTMADVCSVWLSLNFEDLKNLDDVLLKVMPKSQLTEIKSSPSSYLAACKSAAATLDSINEAIELHTNLWRPVFTSLQCLKDDFESTTNPLDNFKDIIKGNATLDFNLSSEPETLNAMHNHALDSWRPNQRNLEIYLKRTLSEAEIRETQLKNISGNIAKLRDSALRRVTKKMTLSEKLALMKNRQTA